MDNYFVNYMRKTIKGLCNSFHILCVPESFNMNISHQLFDYKITFVNLQREITNS